VDSTIYRQLPLISFQIAETHFRSLLTICDGLRAISNFLNLKPISRKFKSSAGNLNLLLKNKISNGKSKFPTERGMFNRKFRNSAGKKFIPPTNEISS